MGGKGLAIVVESEALEMDPEGYLVHIEDWSPDVAEAMALADGCVLTAAHWQVIDFLRGYYAEYGFAPAVRILTRAIGRRLGWCRSYAGASPGRAGAVLAAIVCPRSRAWYSGCGLAQEWS